MKPCPKTPTKEVLLDKFKEVCIVEGFRAPWVDEKHVPDKRWLVDVLATFKPDDEIFKKGYVPPPIRKRL